MRGMKWPRSFEDIAACIGMGFVLCVVLAMLSFIAVALVTHLQILAYLIIGITVCFFVGYFFVTKILKIIP